MNGPTVPTWEYPPEAWDRVLSVDLTGVFYCCRAIVPHMRSNRYGRIVNIASIAGKEGNPNNSAYSAAKAGVIALTKSLANELSDSGVTVNSLAPAITETDLFKEMSQEFIEGRRRRFPSAASARSTRSPTWWPGSPAPSAASPPASPSIFPAVAPPTEQRVDL